MRPYEAYRVGNAGRRTWIPGSRLPYISFDVVNGEDLKGGKADGKRGKLPDDLAAVSRGHWRLRRRIVNQTAVIDYTRCSEVQHASHTIERGGGSTSLAGRFSSWASSQPFSEIVGW